MSAVITAASEAKSRGESVAWVKYDDFYAYFKQIGNAPLGGKLVIDGVEVRWSQSGNPFNAP